MSLNCCFIVPLSGSASILSEHFTLTTIQPHFELGIRITLLGGFSYPFNRFELILLDTPSRFIRDPEIVLGKSNALGCRLLEQLDRKVGILFNTFPDSIKISELALRKGFIQLCRFFIELYGF